MTKRRAQNGSMIFWIVVVSACALFAGIVLYYMLKPDLSLLANPDPMKKTATDIVDKLLGMG